MEKNRILVVGGAGYIGGAITDELGKAGYDFMVYDALLYERDYRKPVPFVFGDIRETKKLRDLISSYKPTAIIWLAALVGDGACQINPELTIDVNQKSVKWLSENYFGRIVFTSTCSVYGKRDSLITEDSETNPLSVYATTKLRAEDYLKGKNAVIFRLGTLHGVSDNFSRVRLDLVVNILSLKAANGENLTVFGGDQWRPLLHVKDAAKAIAGAAIMTKKNVVPTGTYNIASENMTIRELAERIKDSPSAPRDLKVVYTDSGAGDARNYRVSSDKYLNTPGHVEFNRKIEDGSAEIIALVRERRIKNPFDDNFHNEKHVKGLFKSGNESPSV